MRIGLEMFGAQMAGRRRGVGRYVASLTAALMESAPIRNHEVVLYSADGLPTDLLPAAPEANLRRLRPTPTLGHSVLHIVEQNPDALDWLVLMNPLELAPGFDISPRLAKLDTRPRIASVVYDLIPLLFPQEYLQKWPAPHARRYALALERLRTYDRLLAISEATRADLLRVLELPPGRVATIGAAVGGPLLGAPPNDTPDDRAVLARLGLSVERPFILALGADDPRKNTESVFEAFSRLDRTARSRYRLVVAGALGADQIGKLRTRAESLGLEHGVDYHLVGPVDDKALGALYRRCSAFVFPSRYEGFGLPLLEAMACGAPVVAGRNSSQAEVVGDAGVLADVSDTQELADALARVLTDSVLRLKLREAGPERARGFSWERVAGLTLATLEREPVENPGKRRSSRPDRLKVAVICGLPPGDRSASAEQADRLIGPLAEEVSVDVFHSPGMFPFRRFQTGSFGGRCLDVRMFGRFQRLAPYDAVVRFEDESRVDISTPSTGHPIPKVIVVGESVTPVESESSNALVFRSRAAHERSRETLSGYSGISGVVPFGVEPRPQPCRPEDRVVARRALGLPVEGLLLGVFTTRTTQSSSLPLESLAELARSRGVTLLLVGRPAVVPKSRSAFVHAPGASVVSRCPSPNPYERRLLAEAVDLAVCDGEDPLEDEGILTCLELLAVGTPTVVWGRCDFPFEVVVQPGSGSEARERVDQTGLTNRLAQLAEDSEARSAIGRAAWAYARRVHAWPVVASGLARVIRQVVEDVDG